MTLQFLLSLWGAALFAFVVYRWKSISYEYQDQLWKEDLESLARGLASN